MTTPPVLPIPSPLLADWTAPPGTYSPPPIVPVRASCHADLSAAEIVGPGTGYLFRPDRDGVTFSTEVGQVSALTGIVLGAAGAGNRVSVIILGRSGSYLHNVITLFLYKAADVGRADVAASGIDGDGFGSGVRTFGSIELDNCTLKGGAKPPSGNPSPAHALDLTTDGTVVSDQILIVSACDLSGFTTDDFQGDGPIGEESVDRMLVYGNTIRDVSDACVDSKARQCIVAYNTLAGRAGSNRVYAQHTGRGFSIGNLYTVPAGAYGLQATAGDVLPGLLSSGDTFFMLDPSSGVAKAEVACKGSQGFTTTRVGRIQVNQPILQGATPRAPYAFPKGACDGVIYTPIVTVIG